MTDWSGNKGICPLAEQHFIANPLSPVCGGRRSSFEVLKKNPALCISHLLCVLDTSCHFQRVGLHLWTTPHPPTVLIFYSQTGRLTYNVGGLGEVWPQGEGRPRPHTPRTVTVSDGEGWAWGGGLVGGWGLGLGGRCQSTKIHLCLPVLQWRDFFQNHVFLLMTIADSPLLGQSASGLNFYNNGGRSPLADYKPFFRHFFLR
jgi:hypothetical protein